MYSKLNCYKFQTSPVDDKETKFQKYLRERNEKLLEKCFNIKIEKTIVKDNEIRNHLQDINNEKLLKQSKERQSNQQPYENISLVTTNPQEEALQLVPLKLKERVSNQQRYENNSPGTTNPQEKALQLVPLKLKEREPNQQRYENNSPGTPNPQKEALQLVPLKLKEREPNQQRYENISLVTTNPQEEALQLVPLKVASARETFCKTENAIKAKKPLKNMQSSKPARLSQSPNKKPIPSAQSLSNFNRSLSSKPLKTMQSKRSDSSANWKSPFNSFTTKGISGRVQRSQQCSEFSYDLSRDELTFAGHFRSPMRPAPEAERELLKSGQRREYLMQRYEHYPVVKYNYPEATSWRIGWLQQKK